MAAGGSTIPLAIAMTIAPRRRPTLHESLASLRGAGFTEDVRLFAEPGTFDHLSRPTDARTIIRDNPSTQGCFHNWRQAITSLLSETDALWLLVVQDDAVWAPGSADILREHMVARQDLRTGFLSPYVTDKNAIEAAFVDGWNECSIGWTFWGALAFCMKRATAEELLRHPRFAQHQGTQQIDAVVSASMLDLDLPSFVLVPSLVDHIGDTSTVGHDDVAGTLRGYRFDEGRRTRELK